MMEHVTVGYDCPCGPRFYRVCDECEADGEYTGAARADLPDAPTHPGCWKCERGLIEITRGEAELADEPLVIVHNAPSPHAPSPAPTETR